MTPADQPADAGTAAGDASVEADRRGPGSTGRDDAMALLPRRTALLAKVLLLFIPLVLLLAGLIVFATVEADHIHQDLARVVEEDRELELSRALAVELRGAETWVSRIDRTAAGPGVVDDITQHVARARALVLELAGGPGHLDPSDAAHQTRESDLSRSIIEGLERAETVARAPSWEGLPGLLSRARRAAEVLEKETEAEASEAALDLDRRLHRLVNSLTFVGIVGLVTAILLAWAFRRLVLRPLRRLRRAAVELGRTGSATPVAIHSRDEFGQLTHTFNAMVQRLASSRQDLEQRVEQRSLELLRTARLADLGTIAAGIAHEINNPLASIAAGVEGLQRELRASDGVPQATLDYIDIVVKEAYRAKDIASRLLRFGRQQPQPHQPVWLAAEARDVASMLSFQAESRQVTIELDFPERLPPIQGDPAEWRQVLFNLLRNAVDAAPGSTTVRVSAAQDGGTLVLRVRDAGPGFAAQDVDRVFEPFFTTKAPGEGTGLGLAIVERIVRDNHGTIRALNWGGGGEIQIRLPWPD